MSDVPPKTAAEKKAERSSGLEEQILDAQKRRDERSFLEELAKRITIAREGRVFSDKKDFSKAIACYRRFLTITARAVGCEIEELKPQLFDEKNRSAEALLISSILFDTLKILDKLNTPSAKEERKLYHRLFVRFTLGQKFQMFAAENMRKFIVYRKSIRNKSEFWATYHQIRVKKFCAVASWAYDSENAPEVRRLRKFRDERLAQYGAGRSFIEWYYQNGSSIVKALKKVPGAKSASRTCLGFISRSLG